MDNIKKSLHTILSSKIEVIGERTCEHCQATVQIIQTSKGEVSECINCENLKLSKEHTDYVERNKPKDHELLHIRYSNVPYDLEGATFKTYIPKHPTQKEALKKAVWYANNFDTLTDWNSLLFKGTYGIGKSHLSKAIMDRLMENGKSCIFIDVPSLMDKIKNTFKTGESTEELYNAVSKADMVIFDDLGAEYIKQSDNGESFVGEVLFKMFSNRNGKPKIITTNCGSKELIAMYGKNGSRIISRMNKGTKVVVVEGEDMRLQEF